MKVPLLVALCVVSAVLTAGCDHLATMPPSAADRVLTGVVTTKNGGGKLPEGAVVEVRLVDMSQGQSKGEELGEVTIKDAGSMPVPFRIEYRAEEVELMRNSLNVEARISARGRLYYMTTTGHPVSLSNAGDSHVVEVEFAGRR